jgi:hypothetical protein
MLTYQRIVKALLMSREAFNVLVNHITTQRIVTMIPYYILLLFFILYIFLYIIIYYYYYIFFYYIFLITFFNLV